MVLFDFHARIEQRIEQVDDEDRGVATAMIEIDASRATRLKSPELTARTSNVPSPG